MKKTYLVLALLITEFLVASDAYGENEVYYCAENNSIGFKYDNNGGSYQPTQFFIEKFKMKLDRASNHIETVHDDGSGDIYTCTAFSPNTGSALLGCVVRMNHFNFNTKNGRFVKSKGFGYVAGDHDSIQISFGNCDKFEKPLIQSQLLPTSKKDLQPKLRN